MLVDNVNTTCFGTNDHGTNIRSLACVQDTSASLLCHKKHFLIRFVALSLNYKPQTSSCFISSNHIHTTGAPAAGAAAAVVGGAAAGAGAAAVAGEGAAAESGTGTDTRAVTGRGTEEETETRTRKRTRVKTRRTKKGK